MVLPWSHAFASASRCATGLMVMCCGPQSFLTSAAGLQYLRDRVQGCCHGLGLRDIMCTIHTCKGTERDTILYHSHTGAIKWTHYSVADRTIQMIAESQAFNLAACAKERAECMCIDAWPCSFILLNNYILNRLFRPPVKLG